MKKPCCTTMQSYLEFKCDIHTNQECPDCVIITFPDGRIGIPVRDGGRSIIEIKFCPWCGKKV